MLANSNASRNAPTGTTKDETSLTGKDGAAVCAWNSLGNSLLLHLLLQRHFSSAFHRTRQLQPRDESRNRTIPAPLLRQRSAARGVKETRANCSINDRITVKRKNLVDMASYALVGSFAALVAVLLLASPATAKLTTLYYQKTCPNVEKIVSDVCPGVVSCADVLALATRELVLMLGGPFYRVRLGRKDALTSTTGSIAGNLPGPNMTVDQLISLFARRHFTVQELVVLSGAHTVGFSHCSQFASRIFGYDGGARDAHDPAMNPQFAQALQKACADYVKNPTIAAFNDVMTPGKFDNMYYQNLLQGLGLLASDQALAADPRTKPFVQLYAANQTAFFNDFSRAMEKVSVLGVKAGRKGEVRRRCDVFNNLIT
ncbi:hypothetical protein GW17_00002182 [Ensete ventricosum]|nr:hypothetical protein GW17_00002182 [Ensete ventricosum]